MSKAPIVTVNSGQLQGSYEENGKFAVFKGIPYAKPPVGELRWRPPQPAESWEGVRSATKYGPAAYQRGTEFHTFLNALIDGQGWPWMRRSMLKTIMKFIPTPKQSEDCLYLNIRTSSLDRLAKLPVMIWIHGGDHQDGSGAEPFYESNALVEQAVVFVTINYRLGFFGYFTHPELNRESPHGVSGNYGTLDQIAALQWVQDNIAAFGGDPNNVTIFGESAGGESVAHMLTSPLAHGLFHKAIMQSPANGGQMLHLSQPFMNHPPSEERGITFATKAGVAGKGHLRQLRQRTADDLQAIVRQEKGAISAFYPVIDGYVLPQSPFTAFFEGNQAKVPLIVGSNADEGSLIFAVFPTPLVDYFDKPMTPEYIPNYLREAFGSNAQKVCDLYPGVEEANRKAMSDLLGDSMFNAKTRFYAEYAAKAGQSTYYYQFNRVPPSAKQTAGAFHAAEIPFVHGTNTPILPLTEQDKALSQRMITYWTQFAKTGDPNSEGQPTWLPFAPDNPKWMLLGPNIGMDSVDREEKYKVLNGRTLHQVKLMKELQMQ